jgi:hypothetical protein
VPGTSTAVRIACARTMALLVSFALAAQDVPLHITVVSGEGAVHAAGAHVAKPVIVQITDGSGRPVEGARVSFQIPEDGPGGLFATGLRTDLVTTDSRGRAVVRSLQLNRIAGSFSIRITAAKERARAGMMVKQSIGEASAPAASAVGNAPSPVPAPTISAPAPTANPQPVAAKAAAPAAVLPPSLPKPASVPTIVTSQPKGAPDGARNRTQLTPQAMTQTTPGLVPTIVITQRSGKPLAEVGSAGGGGSHKKWIWLGLLAGAAAGGLVAWRMGSGTNQAQSSTSSAAGLSSAATIGTPTITLGKP